MQDKHREINHTSVYYNEHVKSEIKGIIYDHCKENKILRCNLNPI